MRVTIVRHAQTEWNQKDLAIGQTDVDLSKEGERQLDLLRDRFNGVRVGRVLSSDLKRCKLTAEAISDATGVPVEIRSELRERSFGDWEGNDYAQVSSDLLKMTRELGLPLHDVNPPNGESHREIWHRVEPVIEPLFTSDEDTILVSHGGTSRVMLSILIRANYETTFCFKFDNTSVTELLRRPDGAFLMTLYNDTSHLRRSDSKAIV